MVDLQRQIFRRACLHGGGWPQVGEVTRLSIRFLICSVCQAIISCLTVFWETKYGRFTTLNIPKCEHFTLLVCPLQFSGDFCHETARLHVSLLSFLPWTRPRVGGLPHLALTRLHGKLSPRLTGLPYLADRATRLGRSPHLSCKRDQDKIRNYIDRRVISPTWGPPLPCKQALIVHCSASRHAVNNNHEQRV